MSRRVTALTGGRHLRLDTSRCNRANGNSFAATNGAFNGGLCLLFPDPIRRWTIHRQDQEVLLVALREDIA